MTMRKHILLLSIIGISALALTPILQEPVFEKDAPVAESLFSLGEEKPAHYLDEITSEMIKSGEDLVKQGRTVLPDGTASRYISKYYTCTSCHNVKREDPDLSMVDQDARLEYAIDNQLAYLQSSTFWGMVNRETWYNDDYVLKYGDLVTKAEHSLAESVKLCATVCSQGRELEDWELTNILAYFWSLEMKMKDLDFTEKEWESLNNSDLDPQEKTALIKSKYLQKSPATFVDPPEDKRAGYPYPGDAKLGKAIYELGCQHCHRPQGESEVIFDNTQLTLNWLKRHIPDHSDKSIYEIIRKGTYSEYGHKEYMPHYTLEKMSHQQVEHLRAFIESGSL